MKSVSVTELRQNLPAYLARVDVHSAVVSSRFVEAFPGLADLDGWTPEGWVARDAHHHARQAVFDFLAHPSCLVVEDPEFRTIERICDLVNEAKGRAEVADLGAGLPDHRPGCGSRTLQPGLADDLTRAQYRSLRRLVGLPASVQLLPTHGAGSLCGIGTAPGGEHASGPGCPGHAVTTTGAVWSGGWRKPGSLAVWP